MNLNEKKCQHVTSKFIASATTWNGSNALQTPDNTHDNKERIIEIFWFLWEKAFISSNTLLKKHGDSHWIVNARLEIYFHKQHFALLCHLFGNSHLLRLRKMEHDKRFRINASAANCKFDYKVRKTKTQSDSREIWKWWCVIVCA